MWNVGIAGEEDRASRGIRGVSGAGRGLRPSRKAVEASVGQESQGAQIRVSRRARTAGLTTP